MPITIFNDFYAYGNLYFIGSVSYKIFKSSDSYLDYEDIQDLVIIYKFNPVDSSLEYKQLPQHSTGFDFCISKTGSWAFIAVLEDYTYMAGSPEIYTLSMDNETPPQKLLCTEYYYSSLDNCVRGFCYDKNTNTFYYSLENLYDMQTSGLYKLTADFKGNFPIENLVFDDSFFPCKLYSNKEGLWGLIENAKDADTSSLVLLKDPDGNSIKNRSEDADIQVPGSKYFNRNVLVEDDFILFINKTKSKVLKFSNGKISDVSKYRPHRKSYTQEDLITINNLIMEDNLSKKTASMPAQFFISGVIIIAVLMLIIIFLLLWILHLNNKSNQLKKDKKFILNIQEAERGKVSHDIHDSIIQDIRAIRIKTELLQVMDKKNAPGIQQNA